MSEQEKYGYILRVKTEEWENQIFEIRKYYVGLRRDYRRGRVILFMKKVKVDSIVGYGIIDKVEMLWEMTPEEEAYCKENKWRFALSFKPLIRFRKPYPKKVSILKDDKRKGSFLHGARLTENQVEAILDGAEKYQDDTLEES